MRRVALFIFAACASFAVGILAARTWQVISSPSSAVIPSVGITTSPVEMKTRSYHRGPAGLATRGSFITLNSSDGMSFTKWSVWCRSADEATLKLHRQIRGAVKIFSREPVVDQNGQQIGEKVVALFSARDSRNASASLLWTENDEFFQVEGSSLQDILEYRKDFNR